MSRIRSLALIFVYTLTCVSTLSLHSQQAKVTKPNTVATVKGLIITEDDLRKAAAPGIERAEIQHLQSEANYERLKHQVLVRALAGLIEDKVLEAEAASRGVTKKELLEKELAGKVKEPTMEDLSAHYPLDKQPSADTRVQVFARMRQYLKAENYNKAKATFVAELKKKYGVIQLLKPQRLSVGTAGFPSLGPDNAPVTIVEFVNYQCSDCRGFQKAVGSLVKKYGNQVRLVSRNFALEQPYSAQAAQAALCAGDQGRFWEMHDLFFQTGHPEPQFFNMQASALKLNLQDFGACLDSGRHADTIKKDLYAAASLGVMGTPALFVNGRPVLAPHSIDDVANLIDDELHGSVRAFGGVAPTNQASRPPAPVSQEARK
jgi:protein-disulfide isomerase